MIISRIAKLSYHKKPDLKEEYPRLYKKLNVVVQSADGFKEAFTYQVVSPKEILFSQVKNTPESSAKVLKRTDWTTNIFKTSRPGKTKQPKHVSSFSERCVPENALRETLPTVRENLPVFAVGYTILAGFPACIWIATAVPFWAKS